MSFAPSGRAWARGAQARPGQVDPTELIHVRKLYLEKRYKQCVAACDEYLQEQLHPLHKAFFLFQQALSYEAMGLGAHKYSRNRIPFFESAEEKFMSVLEILEPSPAESLGEDVPSSPVLDEALHSTPTRLISASTADVSSDSSSVYSSHSGRTAIFGGYLATPNGRAGLGSIPRTVTFLDVHKQDQALNSGTHARGNHESHTKDQQHLLRLTASLSSTHILADELVPEPLFKSCANKAETTTFSQSTSTFADDEDVSTPRARPPLLPHGGSNSLQTPNARSLLPSPLQNTPLSCYTDDSLPSSGASTIKPDVFATPITPRFDLIHSIFANPRPEPYWPGEPDWPLNSRPANTALTAFLTAVRSALSATRGAITSTQELQDEHAAAKRRAFIASTSDAGKRMASYWLLDAPDTPTTTTITRRRKGAAAQGRERKDPEEDEAAKKHIRERVEKLRAAGWPVKKEKFGWKGVEHYDTLVREVDFEIRLGVGAIGVKQDEN
ncbi:hypothetical protein DV738_g28, partial [Chaetothyriales sp. CBS 135597]